MVRLMRIGRTRRLSRLPVLVRAGPGRSLALLAGSLPILGQPDLVEHERCARDQAKRHQRERQVLPEPAAEHERAGDSGEDEQTGGAEAGDPGSSAHAAPPVLIGY